MSAIVAPNIDDDFFKLMVVTMALLIFGGYIIWKKKDKKIVPSLVPVPKKWRLVGEISKINLYPLKSGKHKVLDSAECTKVGLKERTISGTHSFVDRSFVVFNEATNEKITIQHFPQLLSVEVNCRDEETVVFSSPATEDLVLKIPSSKHENVSNFVIMWYKEKVCTIDCGQEASDWFTRLITLDENIRCRLGYYARDILPARRLQNGSWDRHAKVYKKMHDEYMGSYSDLASYMVMTQSSMDDLNNRLTEDVSEYNFRPNIMVKNTKTPYEEDNWDWLKIGEDTVLRTFKLCTRCLVVTTNPETMLRHPEQEPLKTLRKYRVIADPEVRKVEGQSPVMGLYMGLHRTGVINIGDPVYVNAK